MKGKAPISLEEPLQRGVRIIGGKDDHFVAELYHSGDFNGDGLDDLMLHTGKN